MIGLLFEYKKFSRFYLANGWYWFDEWVCDGCFWLSYVFGGVVMGWWVLDGGGVL